MTVPLYFDIRILPLQKIIIFINIIVGIKRFLGWNRLEVNRMILNKNK